MQHQPGKLNKRYPGKSVVLLKFTHRFLSFIHQQRTYPVQFILHKHAAVRFFNAGILIALTTTDVIQRRITSAHC